MLDAPQLPEAKGVRVSVRTNLLASVHVWKPHVIWKCDVAFHPGAKANWWSCSVCAHPAFPGPHQLSPTDGSNHLLRCPSPPALSLLSVLVVAHTSVFPLLPGQTHACCFVFHLFRLTDISLLLLSLNSSFRNVFPLHMLLQVFVFSCLEKEEERSSILAASRYCWWQQVSEGIKRKYVLVWAPF